MDPRITDALVKIAVAFIGVLAVVIEAWAVKFVKARFTDEQLTLARTIAQVTVDAVEALAANGTIDYKGKFAEALRRVKDLATAKGISLTDEQWQSMIEAAVAAMKRMGDELQPKAPAEVLVPL